MSRAATTLSWWRRSGVTTFATSGWSSSTSAASTTSPGVVADFAPAEGRRLGVLVDHLVPGSKESQIADGVRSGAGRGHVLVLGHPYVDIWEAVKPTRLGLAGWPEVPRTVEGKHGICAALGLPHRDQADLAAAWRMILGRVRSWDDLERPLLTVVEQLIDFVTEDHQ
jgi:DUF3097 family protein